MERNTFWLLIGVGVVFGLAMELMKGTVPNQDKIRDMAGGFEQELVDDSIVNLRKAQVGSIKGATSNPHANTHPL